MPTLQEQREQRVGLWNQMTDLLNRAEGESRELTAEEAQQYDAMEKDVDKLGAEIAEAEKNSKRRDRHEARRQEMDSVRRDPAIISTDDDDEDAAVQEYREAFLTWTRFGGTALEPEQRKVLQQGFSPIAEKELRAQGIATGAAGGYLVPEGFRNRLQERMKFVSQMREVSTVLSTESGNALPWPTNDDTANKGAILAENTQVTEQDVTLGVKTLGAFMYTSKLVRVALQLIQDSGVDVEALLSRLLGNRIGRIQNEHFTTGVGTTQPEGVQTNAAIGKTGAGGQVTTFLYDDLIDLIHSVDVAYRRGGNVGFMLNDLTLASARKLKDTTGQPLWQPSIQAGVPDTLLGYGLFINNDMPVPAASAKSILFGDFEAGYVIRDVTGVNLLRLDERYADYLQVGFLAFQRSDGIPQDTNAYKAYAHPAA